MALIALMFKFLKDIQITIKVGGKTESVLITKKK